MGCFSFRFINSVAELSACCNSSDLQLAIALQQQEFEQQPQRNPPQQPSDGSSSRLITGPQVRRAFYDHYET